PHGDASPGLRARSWLQGNCAHCHQPGGFVPPDLALDLRFETPLHQMHACDVLEGGGSKGARLIEPGAAERSVILRRIGATDADRMPPDGGLTTDPIAVQALTAWIDGLAGCEAP